MRFSIGTFPRNARTLEVIRRGISPAQETKGRDRAYCAAVTALPQRKDGILLHVRATFGFR